MNISMQCKESERQVERLSDLQNPRLQGNEWRQCPASCKSATGNYDISVWWVCKDCLLEMISRQFYIGHKERTVHFHEHEYAFVTVFAFNLGRFTNINYLELCRLTKKDLVRILLALAELSIKRHFKQNS